jgi:transposase InsO family protein/ribonuclease HI
MSEVKNQLTEWLKLGVVEPCRSKYNSPIFVVSKKDGGLRIVQDFRALNAETYVDKYSMHDVNECVAEIGRSGSTIFSTLDLTSGFWQMQLEPQAKETTAFTIPGIGQYCWTVAPMGLLGSPASFQRLVETVLKGITNVIVYIDDLIIHTDTHRKHRETLQMVFDRLRANNLKVNLKKCEFGSTNVSYLGFRLTPEGIKPGIDKLAAVFNTPPPTCIKEVRQFLGLCNFFRAHVKNFSLISHPLTALTKKDCKWKRGPLPQDALKAFRELQTTLCSEPVIDYPRKNRPYVLITDASFGDEKTPGGLGAILTQVDNKNEHRVIAYASRKLAKHEKNYTPFLLEMQAALWAMDHFHVYLKGNHFTLMTDHKPLETMGTIHTKTLNRLQEAMNTVYSFNIVYKKGAEMPADFLSRNAIDAISWDNNSLKEEQRKDPICEALINFLYNRQLPSTTVMQGLVKLYATECFMENGLLWRRLKRKGDTAHIVLFVPSSMRLDILKEAHGGQLTGHDGIFKTKERILNCYYWPGMDRDINEFIKRCVKCQQRTKTTSSHTELQPLPQCSEPNQRVHADLFGPLKTSGSGKKYILCITDAFTKYIELVALPDKEAETVAQALFNRWICRYGSPLQLTTDGGKEFCAKLSEQLYKHMKIEHLTTSPYHPQCNSQAEVVNKTIAKYLSSFVDETTLDWELYLPPLMFSYNTSMNSTTKFTPFFLTFGQLPRAPHFPTPDLTKKFYGESTIDEMYIRLQQARQLAIRNNEEVRDSYEQKYNKDILPIIYAVGQEVFLDEHNFLHKNKKLAPQFSGPHIIEKLIGKTNAQLKLKNGKTTIVHLNRIKPYLSQADKLVERNLTDEDNKVIIHSPPMLSEDENEDDTPPHSSKFLNHPRHLIPTLPDTPPREEPPKKKRGRPKKLQKQTLGEEMGELQIPPTDQEIQQMPEAERRITRSQLKQMTPEERAQYLATSYVNALKRSRLKKKKVKRETLKTKRNGSSNAKWSKLQKMYFKLFGDIDGPAYQMEHAPQIPVHNPDGDGSEHSSQSSYNSDWASESETELEWSDFEFSPTSESEREDEQQREPSPEPQEEAEEDDQGGNQGGYDGAEEKAEEAPHQVAQGGQDLPAGAMLHMPQKELPNLQGPGRDDQKGHATTHKVTHSPPSSSLYMSKAGFMSARTLPRTPNPVPPSSLQSETIGKHQGAISRHGYQRTGQGASHSQVHEMGASSSKKDDPLRSPTFRRAVPKAGPTAKPTIALKRLSSPLPKPHQPAKNKNDIELLAQIVGLSPGSLSKQAKQELVGKLVIEAATDAMSTLARTGAHAKSSVPQQQPSRPRSKTPSLSRSEKEYKDKYQTVQQAQAVLETEKELAQAGLTRPTRSKSRGPPITSLPRIPIEYKKRMSAAELHRLEWLEAEKKRAEEQRALEDKKRHSSY